MLSPEEYPTVFIGVPVRNGGKYLEQALESIRRQTHSHWLAVISDNCSTDETSSITQRYVAMDSRFKVVRHDEPKSSRENFGYLLEEANTEYFCWIAADDFWSPSYLHELVGALEGNPQGGLAFGPYTNCDVEGQILGKSYRLRYESMFPFSRLARFLLSSGANRDAIFYGVYRRKYIDAAEVWKTNDLDAGRPMAYAALARALLTSKYVFADGDNFLWVNRIHNESYSRADPPQPGWLELRGKSMLREAQSVFGVSFLPLIATLINLFVWLEGKRDFLHDIGGAIQSKNVKLLIYLLGNHPQRPGIERKGIDFPS